MAAFSVLPERYSSRMRSNTTMFASAATPMVKIMPAIPGRVIVTGIARITPKNSAAKMSSARSATSPSTR